MGTQITETEVVAGSLRRVTLGGTKFRVPASPTLKYLFWMRNFLGKFAEGTVTDDDLVDCYDQTVAFLRRYNENVDEDKLQETCEIHDLITFYNRCYGLEPDGEDSGPPRAPTRGGRSSKRAPSRSRSST